MGPDMCANCPSDYTHLPRGCVHAHNIKLHKGKTVAECAAICDANPLCLAFEYGVEYNGSGPYEAKDCHEQSSADPGTCDGGRNNLDLYIKPVCDASKCPVYCAPDHMKCPGPMQPDGTMGPDTCVPNGQHCPVYCAPDQMTCPGPMQPDGTMGPDMCANCPSDYTHLPRGCVHAHNIELHKGKTVAECAAICDANPLCLAFEYGVEYGGKYHEAGDCQEQSSAEVTDCDGTDYNLDVYVSNGKYKSAVIMTTMMAFMSSNMLCPS